MKDKIAAKVSVLRSQEQEQRAKERAAKLDLNYINLLGVSIDWQDVELIKENLAKKYQTGVIARLGKKIKLGTTNPELAKKIKLANFEIELYLISEKSLNKILDTYKEIPHKVQKEEIQISKEKNLKKLDNKPVSELLNVILSSAIAQKASDIHFEPAKEKARIRFRLDGILKDMAEINSKNYQAIAARLKLLAKLKINITNIPQNGRLSIILPGLTIDARLSVLPGPQGESISLRLLDPRVMSLGLEELGLNKKHLEILKQELKRPHGMILVTGPTGSGKTTTLYACLMEIHKPGIKIITIEDPIEYRLGGIVQTQIDENYSFAAGLKNILRQDPDIILIGEIRDKETAETALHAALTGHLVFSTLHTNDASGAIPRLIDLGIKPEIIDPAINLIIAQRLVRRKAKGRVGIFEMLKPGEKLAIAMRQDGLEKVKQGITTKEEIDQVTSQ